MEKREPSCSVGWMQTDATTLENIMEIPQKLKKNRSTLGSINHTTIYPKNTKILILKDICTPMCIATLSTIPKLWNSPNVHWLMSRPNRCGRIIQCDIIQP